MLILVSSVILPIELFNFRSSVPVMSPQVLPIRSQWSLRGWWKRQRRRRMRVWRRLRRLRRARPPAATFLTGTLATFPAPVAISSLAAAASLTTAAILAAPASPRLPAIHTPAERPSGERSRGQRGLFRGVHRREHRDLHRSAQVSHALEAHGGTLVLRPRVPHPGRRCRWLAQPQRHHHRARDERRRRPARACCRGVSQAALGGAGRRRSARGHLWRDGHLQLRLAHGADWRVCAGSNRCNAAAIAAAAAIPAAAIAAGGGRQLPDRGDRRRGCWRRSVHCDLGRRLRVLSAQEGWQRRAQSSRLLRRRERRPVAIRPEGEEQGRGVCHLARGKQGQRGRRRLGAADLRVERATLSKEEADIVHVWSRLEIRVRTAAAAPALAARAVCRATGVFVGCSSRQSPS
mmetsp:Transcript_15403/g.48906  ORF Transcript_15403/g.48906 Transcript_15403/m.48906 type:complete len:405 (+) Transcript_15403:1567-2781(+)